MSMFMNAISAMSKLSVQSSEDGSSAMETKEVPPPDSGLLHKEKLVIPKVKREPLSDQNGVTNRMSTPGSARKRAAAAKHSNTAAAPPVPVVEPPAMEEPQSASVETTTGGWSGWTTQAMEQLSFQGALACAPEPQSDALTTEPSPIQDAGHERYDMCYRSPMALHGMLEAISEARSIQATPLFDAPLDVKDMTMPEAACIFDEEKVEPPSAGQWEEESMKAQISTPGKEEFPSAPNGQRSGTLVMFDQVFFDHRTGKGCQECPERMDILIGGSGALTAANEEPLDFEQHSQEATLADILRVHEWDYIRELERKCHAVPSGALDGKEPPVACLDPPGHPQDTKISKLSYKVAAAAAGAVCAAVDRVLGGRCHNAFVAARPPGHHAGPSGLVYTDDGRPSLSQGFCLLNSVAIGAAYCKYNYRHLGVERVAIVDFDIHNGDGTAACVRNLTPHSTKRRLGAGMELSASSYKPWLDEHDSDNVFFASMHLCTNNFYPRMASQQYHAGANPDWELLSTGAHNDEDFPNILNIPLRKTTSKADAAALWRSEVSEKLLPRLTAFDPDVIFLSAGFDGHVEDTKGNNGWFHLVEEDYAWLTSRICEVAERCCNGRVVSVLEGGYHIERPAPPPPRNSRRKSTAAPPPPAKPMPGALATSVSAHVKALQAAASGTA